MSTLAHLLFLLCLITIIIISTRTHCIKDVTVLVVPVILALPSYNCPIYIYIYLSLIIIYIYNDILLINGNEYTEIVTSKHLYFLLLLFFPYHHIIKLRYKCAILLLLKKDFSPNLLKKKSLNITYIFLLDINFKKFTIRLHVFVISFILTKF